MGLVIKTKAVMLVAWGIWLLSPWWTVFDYGRQYAALEAVAPEHVWGIIAAVIGAALFLLANSRRSVLKALLVVEFAMWTFLTFAAAYGEWRPASTIIYASIAMAALVFYIAMIPRFGDEDRRG